MPFGSRRMLTQRLGVQAYDAVLPSPHEARTALFSREGKKVQQTNGDWKLGAVPGPWYLCYESFSLQIIANAAGADTLPGTGDAQRSPRFGA